MVHCYLQWHAGVHSPAGGDAVAHCIPSGTAVHGVCAHHSLLINYSSVLIGKKVNRRSVTPQRDFKIVSSSGTLANTVAAAAVSSARQSRATDCTVWYSTGHSILQLTTVVNLLD